jgi:hypothetical protein
VIADQLPAFKHTTEPGDADESTLPTFAPALSVCVQTTPRGVGPPTWGAAWLELPGAGAGAGGALVPKVGLTPLGFVAAWPVAYAEIEQAFSRAPPAHSRGIEARRPLWDI